MVREMAFRKGVWKPQMYCLLKADKIHFELSRGTKGPKKRRSPGSPRPTMFLPPRKGVLSRIDYVTFLNREMPLDCPQSSSQV